MELAEPLRALAAHPTKSGVYTDFDGTLAPIVDDPDKARPLDGVADALAALAAGYARVGVISGRPVSFLRRAIAAPAVDLWGQYGLERAVGGEVRAVEGAASWRGIVEDVATRAEVGGVAERVERKSLSVTLHYRADPRREQVVRDWAAEEAARTGLDVTQARKAVELRPPIHRDKGTALVEAAAGLGAVCFLGDDRGDLAAFDALDRLAAEGVYAARIAVRSPEMPSDLERRADLIVDGPVAALDVLRALVAAAPAR
jgi:trehalose 6-phosphate phosphatase